MPHSGEAAPPLDETARAILDAASRRFLHYGFGKTTMSEIAGDCNMSTGNLYRFFGSKLDIAEAFVRRLRADQVARLREVTARPGSSTKVGRGSPRAAQPRTSASVTSRP